MSVKILIAGCLPRDRGQIEGVVRKAFQTLPESDPWNVSLVKLGATWSISMEGPELNNFGLSAPEDRLQETLVEALGMNGTPKKQPAPPSPRPEVPGQAESLTAGTVAPPVVPKSATGQLKELGKAEGLTAKTIAAPVETKSATGQDNRYECHACKKSFKVVYVASSDAKVKAPIACPSCWEITEVSVPEGAAATEEYSAELEG